MVFRQNYNFFDFPEVSLDEIYGKMRLIQENADMSHPCNLTLDYKTKNSDSGVIYLNPENLFVQHFMLSNDDKFKEVIEREKNVVPIHFAELPSYIDFFSSSDYNLDNFDNCDAFLQMMRALLSHRRNRTKTGIDSYLRQYFGDGFDALNDDLYQRIRNKKTLNRYTYSRVGFSMAQDELVEDTLFKFVYDFRTESTKVYCSDSSNEGSLALKLEGKNPFENFDRVHFNGIFGAGLDGILMPFVNVDEINVVDFRVSPKKQRLHARRYDSKGVRDFEVYRGEF